MIQRYFNLHRLLSVLALFAATQLQAQTVEPMFFDSEKQMVQETKTALLLQKARRDSINYHAERESAIQIAIRNNLPIEGLRESGSFSLQGFDGSGLLSYYASDNAVSAEVLRTSELHPGGDAALSLTGAGGTLGVWEIGRPRLTHVEFGGRVIQGDNSGASIDNHANHVCGTMVASGINVNARGMAYEANLRAYDANNDVSEMAAAAAGPLYLRVSNHSYGMICGWDYDDYQGQPTWYWWGTPSINSNTEYRFGLYDSKARNFDDVVYDAPFYLPVFAAGNDRDDFGPSPGAQHVVRNASNQWVSSTAIRQPDGGNFGYDCIPPGQCAKNVLSVGAVEAEASGGLVFSTMSEFSSWGPTDDGRIKPDIVARGVDVYSSGSNNNSHYYTSRGTSMAAPSVAGSLQLLLEHYSTLNPGFTIRASALKGLVIHTASDDSGPNYQEGWGLMNTRAAADLMSNSFNASSKDRLVSRDSLSNGGQREYTFYHDGTGPLVATVVWTDPAGPISTNTLNPTQLRLVNDLDIRLVSENDNSVYRPWVLNPGNPSANATKGDNFRDNLEQIYEENLPRGRYFLRVTHKGSLNGGVQFYSLILSGRSNLLTACSGSISNGSGGNNYLNNTSHSWTISPPNAASVTLNFTSFNTELNYDFVKVYNGTSAFDPLLGEFSGASLPPSLTASSGKMFIVFETDGSVTRPGWSANYTCSTPQISVSVNQLFSGSGANTNSFDLVANCNWTISGIPSWLTVTPLSGNSNAQIQVNFSVNSSTATRTANLIVTGCDGTVLTIEVTQFGCSAPSTPNIAANGPTNLCPGENVTLTASNVCSGCTVSWSNGQSGTSISVSTPGTYTASVQNTCGPSSASNAIAVTMGSMPNAPTIAADGPTNLCPGESVTLTASNVCSGCTVSWSNGQSGTSISVSNAGTYTASVINSCGPSSASNAISITIGNTPQAPTIAASGSTSLCPGESVTLTASNVCSGCTVSWSNGQTGASINVSNADTYTASVINTCGPSSASNAISITTGNTSQAPTIAASGPTSLCPGESVTLTASNVCSGCTVSWSNGQSGASINVSNAGIYTASVINTCGPSSASNAISITTGNTPQAPTIAASGPTSLCPGESVTLTASNVCSGCTVSWSNGQSGASISVSNAGTYTASVINICGPSSASNAISITTGSVPIAPTITAEGPTSLCPGESVTLSASNVCSGCTVSWSNGQSGASINVSNAGTYTASVINICGPSSASNAISITAAPPFLPTIQVNNSCQLAAPTGNNYQWFLNGMAISGANGQFWSAQATGYYGVSMTNLAGCAGTSDPVFAEACMSNLVNVSENLSLVLYPNPAKDKITIEMRSLEDLRDIRLELYTFDGRSIGSVFQIERLAGNSSTEIQLPELPAGMYRYRLSSSQGDALGSLMIVR